MRGIGIGLDDGIEIVRHPNAAGTRPAIRIGEMSFPSPGVGVDIPAPGLPCNPLISHRNPQRNSSRKWRRHDRC
jgi:hypothetical protein